MELRKGHFLFACQGDHARSPSDFRIIKCHSADLTAQKGATWMSRWKLGSMGYTNASQLIKSLELNELNGNDFIKVKNVSTIIHLNNDNNYKPNILHLKIG